MRILAAAFIVLLLFVSGCQSDDKADSATPDAATTDSTAATSETPTTAPPVSETPVTETPPGSGDVGTDPCDLLTSDIARGALGVAVGPPSTTPGQGNVTCSYGPADGRPNVFVLLTTYSTSGEAALKDATKAFPDAQPVPDLGDSAYVSARGHAIGVSSGDLLFAMSVLTPAGLEQSPATTVNELVAVVRAVLEAR